MKGRPGFMLYFDLVEALSGMDDVQAGRLFKALMAYAQYGEVRELTGLADFAFRVARPRIDRDAEVYREKCRKNAYYSYVSSAKRRGVPPVDYEEWDRDGTQTVWDPTQGSPAQDNPVPNATTNAAASTKPAATAAAAAGRADAAFPPPVEYGEFSFSPRMQKIIGDWLQYKRERRETYTDMGMQSLFQQLRGNVDRWGEEAVAQLVEECMAAGYRGIVFDRLARGRKEPPRLSEEPSEGGEEWMRPYIEGRKQAVRGG